VITSRLLIRRGSGSGSGQARAQDQGQGQARPDGPLPTRRYDVSVQRQPPGR
jgi:hypothetical protein